MKGPNIRSWHIVGQIGTVITVLSVLAWSLLPTHMLVSTITMFVGFVITLWSLYEIGDVNVNELAAEHTWLKEHGLEGDTRK